MKIKSIRRRTGEVVPFELDRVAGAILKAFEVSGEGDENKSRAVANSVFKTLMDLRNELVKQGVINVKESTFLGKKAIISKYNKTTRRVRIDNRPSAPFLNKKFMVGRQNAKKAIISSSGTMKR